MSENIVNVQETIQTPQEKKLTKKLDNRNQVKIQKNINDFSWFLLHAENP